ncbi:MAG: hypothetical protein II828_03795 [Clostridia bacterium]|nr:hypothetical protein [Clostridia bacterium]
MKHPIGKKISGVMVILALLSMTFLTGFTFAFPAKGHVVTELGQEVSSDPSDYLMGPSFMTRGAQVDVSGVDGSKAGVYPATVKWGFFTYTVEVEVKDTTPPLITADGVYHYYAVGREYVPTDFVTDITDCSRITSCTVDIGGVCYETVTFEEEGQQEATIRATDEWGNESRQQVTFTVDEAPWIIGAFDRHIAQGSDFDVEAVAAADRRDGVLTDRLEIQPGLFDTGTVGDYPVTYIVRDNYGLETVKTVTLSVVPRRELSGYNDDLSLSDTEKQVLCDTGYFTYQPLSEPDCEAAASLIEPTLINLKRFINRYSWVSGSGAVYRVTPDYVIFFSVEHVLKDVHSDCRIMFFDGKTIEKSFDFVSSDAHNELCLFAIPTQEIPTDTLLSLRQIAVDSDIYNDLHEGDDVVSYAKHWDGTSRDLIKPMKMRAPTASIPEFDMIDSLLETTWNLYGGMSGTATVDGRGFLVGAASATGPSATGFSGQSAFHSKIDVLPELEQKLAALIGEDITAQAA